MRASNSSCHHWSTLRTGSCRRSVSLQPDGRDRSSTCVRVTSSTVVLRASKLSVSWIEKYVCTYCAGTHCARQHRSKRQLTSPVQHTCGTKDPCERNGWSENAIAMAGTFVLKPTLSARLEFIRDGFSSADDVRQLRVYRRLIEPFLANRLSGSW